MNDVNSLWHAFVSNLPGMSPWQAGVAFVAFCLALLVLAAQSPREPSVSPYTQSAGAARSVYVPDVQALAPTTRATVNTSSWAPNNYDMNASWSAQIERSRRQSEFLNAYLQQQLAQSARQQEALNQYLRQHFNP